MARVISALSLGLLLSFLVVVCGEVAVRFFLENNETLETTYQADYATLNSFGIPTARPGGTFKSVSVNGRTGKVIYDVAYVIDETGLRITPVDDRDQRDRHLLFFGGSFIYGEGLHENQTIPYYVGNQTIRYQPYNYAFHGSGASEMLAWLESDTLTEKISESEGLLIYTFNSFHIQRAIGSMRVAGSWGANRPYYTINQEGVAVREGDFLSGRPLVTAIYRILSKSKLLLSLGVDIPPRPNRSDYELMAKLIVQARDQYMEQFPAGEFFIVFYPGASYSRYIVPFMDRANIRYLDYVDLLDRMNSRYWLSPEDQHPSALANQIVANQILEDLNLN